MSKRIFNNIFLKIISVILAIIAWLVLVNVSDPTTNITISGVNVNFENESALLDKGYNYEVIDGSKISVDVSGPRSDITSLRASDISAVVDLAKMSEFSDYANIDVTVKKEGRVMDNITVTPKTSSAQLKISNRQASDFKVEVSTVGNPNNNAEIDDISVSPSTVRIAGPSENIEKVAGIKAVVDVQGKKDSISEDVGLELVDKNGKTIQDDSIVISRTTVRVTGNIIATKTIPIKYNTKGNPAQGYKIKNVELSPDKVTISGSETELSNINEFTIPSDALNVTDINTDKTYRIWLSDYAPDGITVLSDNSIQAVISIEKSEN